MLVMRKVTLVIAVLLLPCLALVSSASAVIVVAKDGTGNFSTIQSALNTIPSNNAQWVTILIKNGLYDEHVMIQSNFVALVGESRQLSRIEHNLARAAWNAGEGKGSNIGTGVINIAANVQHVVIANLRIRNTYEASEDYTETIRSEAGSSRIWVMDCDVLSLHKDTFAPWGKAGGMYYVSDCAFRGSIDMFCPRGYCYAINNRYTETRYSSPMWHEGVAGEDQKLVIQGGSVHSEISKTIKLQNSQNYAKFYYLDVKMSDSITELGKSSPTWFYNVKGKSGLNWFANNLTLNDRKQIDAFWTFDGKWDPENSLPSVLPFASMPQPFTGRYAIGTQALNLKWIPAQNILNQKIFFGEAGSELQFMGETTENTFTINNLKENTSYNWKVNSITESGEAEGKIWKFATGDVIEDAVIEDPVNPPVADSTDYDAARLNKYITALNCKTMLREPAWITKSGSVSWTAGTGYRWGSTSAVLTLKVKACTKIEVTYSNGSTTRPITISDGGSGNDVTAYPTAANVESVVTFIPKTTGESDVQIKTGGSSGLTISRIIFYGIQSAVKSVTDISPGFVISANAISAEFPFDVFDITGRKVAENVLHAKLSSGVYIIHFKGDSGKIIIF
jgi:pectinesterase